jgi:hypothetical protein
MIDRITSTRMIKSTHMITNTRMIMNTRMITNTHMIVGPRIMVTGMLTASPLTPSACEWVLPSVSTWYSW